MPVSFEKEGSKGENDAAEALLCLRTEFRITALKTHGYLGTSFHSVTLLFVIQCTLFTVECRYLQFA